MTKRLYYEDSYTINFSATVVDQFEHNEKPTVELDQTYFYPTGGGQPSDLGTINGIKVIEVFSTPNAVLHVLASPVNSGDAVNCQINFARRFDHMQQHTAQHILTQAFIQVANADTVSFHLSVDTVTIDLDADSIPLDTLNKVEDLANKIVIENRPVTAKLIPADALAEAGVRMRKMPEHIHTDGLRVIDIGGFDVTACGGTHVSRTGEIGMIKIVRLEKNGNKTRVEFRCGGRALADYRLKNTIANQLSADLTCAFEATPSAISRLREDLQSAQRALKAATNQLLRYEADEIIAQHTVKEGLRVIKLAFENRDLNEVKILASLLTEQAETIVLLGTAGEKAHLFLARSADLTHNMNQYLKPALEVIGARGGGQPAFVQGGGTNATLTQVEAALDVARALLG